MGIETWWLIEMQGPSYMAARRCGGYEFFWTDDYSEAIRFFSRDQADLVMMTIRQLRGDLFPACLPRVPCAVEHMWAPGEGHTRRPALAPDSVPEGGKP